ncbi:hypothetical protein BOTBODRAFT_466583 [Botryobasidium botryosum FD-172 SS1]|uniref:Uncharacterized protein n=1 Tax=Botryobasidium botryosum (strain FD-172 SS1) TaxID=930990 RepID=A0A067M6B9_BOTB1|nr:hypothetical protein BOTBODRAFT_466583 [Botryobasidium botryosum FD-172 SS1]
MGNSHSVHRRSHQTKHDTSIPQPPHSPLGADKSPRRSFSAPVPPLAIGQGDAPHKRTLYRRLFSARRHSTLTLKDPLTDSPISSEFPEDPKVKEPAGPASPQTPTKLPSSLSHSSSNRFGRQVGRRFSNLIQNRRKSWAAGPQSPSGTPPVRALQKIPGSVGSLPPPSAPESPLQASSSRQEEEKPPTTAPVASPVTEAVPSASRSSASSRKGKEKEIPPSRNESATALNRTPSTSTPKPVVALAPVSSPAADPLHGERVAAARTVEEALAMSPAAVADILSESSPRSPTPLPTVSSSEDSAMNNRRGGWMAGVGSSASAAATTTTTEVAHRGELETDNDMELETELDLDFDLDPVTDLPTRTGSVSAIHVPRDERPDTGSTSHHPQRQALPAPEPTPPAEPFFTPTMPSFSSIPAGTTMIVQGVVQTSSGAPPSPTSASQARPRPSNTSLANTGTGSVPQSPGAPTSEGADTAGGGQSAEEMSIAGSIDMLGMLLGVATAATAASLMSVSNEMQFASNPEGGSEDTSAPATPSSASPPRNAPPSSAAPSMPTTPVLPTHGAAGGAANSGTARALLNSVRDRWFHRRQGSAASQPSPSALSGVVQPVSPTSVTTTSPSEPVSPTTPSSNSNWLPVPASGPGASERNQVEALRENIAAELTRVLTARRMPSASTNNSMTTTPTAATEATPPSSGASTLPTSPSPTPVGTEPSTASASAGGPPGSFERFLHDIQVELRNTLTDRYNRDHGIIPGGASVSPVAAAIAAAADTEGSDESSASPGEDAPAVPAATSPDDSEGLAEPVSDAAPSVPESEPEPAPSTQLAPHLQPHRPSTDSPLNWWRIYQFPARQVPNSVTDIQGTPITTGANNSPTTPAFGPSQPMAAASASSSPVFAGPNSPSFASRASERRSTSTIIPVIVVGLRSASTTADDPFGTVPPSPSSPTANAVDPTPPIEGIPSSSTERPPVDLTATSPLDRVRERLDQVQEWDRERVERAERERARARERTRSYIIWVIGELYSPDSVLEKSIAYEYQ